MRSRVLVIFTAVLLFGLGIAVYAYNSKTINRAIATSCCICCGDSCPMKLKDTNATQSTQGKESCPMMSEKDEGMANHDMKMASGDSCPMMNEGKDATNGDSCSCDCCSHNKESKVTASM